MEEKEEDVKRLKSIQLELHADFIKVVETSRGSKLKDPEKNNIFTGEFWTGKSALDLGLIDGIGNADQILKEKNLLLKKGSPETFDVMGLINFVSRLDKEDEVVIPIFDRSLELSRSSAVISSKNTKVILVEGNYVLLNSYPWKELHKFFNSTIMINCEEKILEKRLIERWENFNLPKEEIDKKVYENDLPNGVNVLKNSIEADYILEN